MPTLTQITNYLNDYLKINEIKDASVNGLQVSGKENIKKIAFAVDACMDTFTAAKSAGADMIIVHHGIIWNGITSVTGRCYEHLKFLVVNEISLYACHLPLDKHPEIGNNIEFLKLFNVRNIEEFGDYHGIFIGFLGEFEIEKDLNAFAAEIEEKLNTKCTILPFGKKKVKKVGVVSGGAASIVTDAAGKVDVFVTGDASHTAYHIAKESGINVIFAGHYATETPGVKALAKKLENEFDIEFIFLDIPTGL
ncbi:MAG: Nif3-like dinuclear metal center hexameric protein [Candidatus Altiarchaeales archaeon HGW-Altiarchaeales-3]|nr:MAG: Nif3-like dinuclear metal center hexameric protein [Candidatus Altiarchaeales archaeon HGW-Altiarchaeales-3]